jgi:hypothetical protein
MRTTITLDDEVAAIVQHYAKARAMSFSKAISELILRSMRTKPRIKYVDGLPVFDLPQTKQKITTERVRAFEAEEW